MEKFWQNFPSSMGCGSGTMRLGLFPSISGVPYELRGGEQKTHTVWPSLSEQGDPLNWVHKPIVAILDSKWFAKSRSLPVCTTDANDGPIKELIQSGLEHENNFFSEHETINEYGWRNFGDLYADHETWRHTGSELFPSHYNNQYDPIYGLLRQFLLSGDSRWFELADDLARHVIDIYHTEEDKAEYNNGLFWHTNHYLKAYTATHRTCSKHQATDLEPHESLNGGGLGGQHCYTSGLTLYYLLTGDTTAKSAVLKLANWITQIFDGSNTCLELLLFIKNRHRQGIKNQFTGMYPFDRGTGNLVIALVDAFQLTQDKNHLHQIENIIKNTIHPNDDIEKHGLSNIEECWFYIVFLQAVYRHLNIKEEIGNLDTNFYYTRNSLLYYADWMLLNEQPYLEKPEKLEFVNDTWAVQDLRKSQVFAAAYYYSNNSNIRYLDKAKYFQNYVVDVLKNSDQLSYTRIQVLLLQNHGLLKYHCQKSSKINFSRPLSNWPVVNYHQSKYFIIAVIDTFFKRLCKLSINNEINWLLKRLGK